MIEFNFGATEETTDFVMEVPEEKLQRVYAPGVYEVCIKEVEEVGKSKKDDTWMQLKITAYTVDDKAAQFSVFVPTKTLAYGATQGISLLWKNGTKPFINGLGIHADRLVSGADIGKILPTILGDASKLIGCFLKIKMGYDANYVKKDKEDGKLKVYSPDGTPVIGYPTWDTYDEQKAYSAQTGTRFGFLQVQSYEPMISAPNAELLLRISNGRIDDAIMKDGNCPF